MNDQSRRAEPTDPQVAAALHDYLERVDRGESVDREEFLARHAPIADQLRSFIAAEDQVRKLAGAATPLDQARDSTKSFVAQGQETLAPQTVAMRNVEPGGTGLSGQFGRYRIIRALGKGAMGTVYLAEDTQLERSIAIKTPHFTESPSAESLERFYREARVAATLRQPHARCSTLARSTGSTTSRWPTSRGDHSAFIKPDKAQTERQILIVIRKLALALQEAHDHGIVHRDLKPANIMVDKKGEPIIMDFGLAQQAPREGDIRLTQTGNIIGTPAYMSPEQVEGEPDKIGPPTDQYSLGVILYELLTAQLPFRGSVIAVMGQILTKEVPPPSQLRPNLDPRIQAVCLKMLSKTPSGRFASLKAIADELATILKSPVTKADSKERSAAAQTGASSDRLQSDTGAAPDLKSLKLKALAESDLTSLEELARKCLARRDYEQVIQVIERIPEEQRNVGLVAILEKARAKADEISFLICDIDEADRLNDGQTALKKAEALLKIKPGHNRARQVQEKFSGNGERRAARIGVLDQFRRPIKEGGWIPWSVLAFGLAVVGVMTGVIVIYVNRTAVLVDIQDPGVEVAVKGSTMTVTGPDKQSVKVVPGDQELTITSAGLETITKSFSLKKGDKPTVKVSIIDSKLMALLENEIAPLTPAHQDQTAATLAPVLKAEAKLPPTFKNSLGMEFVLVPKGKSWLGGGGGTGEREVVIANDFYLGKYEVTQEEWEKVTRTTPSAFSRTGVGKDLVKDIADAALGRFPVESVSWDDAQVFLERLNKREKDAEWVYRLPNEAEWEYACRGGPLADTSQSAYDFYLDQPTNQLLPAQANIDKSLQRTCKVGSYKPNRLGLYDMHGNVWEWCDNVEKTANGTSGREPRGGGWSTLPAACKAANRFGPARWEGRVGLRVARVPVGGQSTFADPDRRAAEWVLSIGGTIKTYASGQTLELKAGNELPSAAFELVVADLGGNPKVTSDGLAHFRDCKNLRALNLTGTKVTDSGLAYFKNCRNLTSLSCGHTQVTDSGLASFKDCQDLADLYLAGSTKVTDSGLAVFKDRKNLRSLVLWGTPATDAGLAYFKDCKNLTVLEVGTLISDAGLGSFENCKNLTYLNLAGSTKVTDRGLAVFKDCKNLTILILWGTQVTDLGLGYFTHCKNLAVLDLSSAPKVSDSGLAYFKDCKDLTFLGLAGTQVTDSGLAYFKDCKSVKELVLWGTQVSDAGLVHFKDCQNLTSLRLDDTKMTDAGLQRLAGFRKLVSVFVKRTNVTESGVKKLAAALPQCKIEWDGGVIGP